MPTDGAVSSNGTRTNLMPPKRMYSIADVSRVSTLVLKSASIALVDTDVAATNAELAAGSSLTRVYCAVSKASIPEN